MAFVFPPTLGPHEEWLTPLYEGQGPSSLATLVNHDAGVGPIVPAASWVMPPPPTQTRDLAWQDQFAGPAVGDAIHFEVSFPATRVPAYFNLYSEFLYPEPRIWVSGQTEPSYGTDSWLWNHGKIFVRIEPTNAVPGALAGDRQLAKLPGHFDAGEVEGIRVKAWIADENDGVTFDGLDESHPSDTVRHKLGGLGTWKMRASWTPYLPLDPGGDGQSEFPCPPRPDWPYVDAFIATGASASGVIRHTQ